MHIILHIGLPKTGTTFLQQQLAFHRERLAANGIFIPKTATLDWVRSLTGDPLSGRMACEENNHLMLAWALQPERWSQFPAAVQRLLPQVWERLGVELAGCESPCCLITAENFSWDLARESQLQSIRDRLSGHEVSVVCCLREPHDFIASMYGQLLSMDRGPYSIDEFIAESYPRWEPDFQESVWSRVFGAGCFRGIAYEPIAGPDILQRFLAAAVPGHPASLRTYPPMPNTDPHRSFSPRFQRFLEELHANRMAADRFTELYRALPDTFTPLEERLLSAADIDAAIARHAVYANAGREPDVESGTPSLDPAEINELRRLLDDRTALLEKSGQALATVTEDLVQTRQLLIERTARLEQAIERLAQETAGPEFAPAPAPESRADQPPTPGAADETAVTVTGGPSRGSPCTTPPTP
jgi:hypothetical protein